MRPTTTTSPHHGAIRVRVLSLFSPMSSTSTDWHGPISRQRQSRPALRCGASSPHGRHTPHRPMIPTSSPRPGRGCAEDLLKRRNTRVAVAFRHRRNLGRMIGHAQRPRYVLIVPTDPTFFLLHSHCLGPSATLFRATTCTVALTLPLHYTILLYTRHSSFPFAFPHFRAGTTLTFTIVIPPATTRPSVTSQLFHSAHHRLFAHITHVCHWLANPPSTHTLNLTQAYPDFQHPLPPCHPQRTNSNTRILRRHPFPLATMRCATSTLRRMYHDLPHNHNHT